MILPGYVMELVKAHTDREQMPGGERFWQAVCEEALANHLWQNADFPPGGTLRAEELTAGLKRLCRRRADRVNICRVQRTYPSRRLRQTSSRT